MKTKLFAVFEIILVYAAIRISVIAWRSTEIWQWEKTTLGWTYIGILFFIGIPALVIWFGRRNWVEFGVSLANWPTNLDIGIKAYLVRIIPVVFGMGGAAILGLNSQELIGDVFIAFTWVIAIAVMIWVLNTQRSVASSRNNLIATALFLLLPILVALTMKKIKRVDRFNSHLAIYLLWFWRRVRSSRIHVPASFSGTCGINRYCW